MKYATYLCRIARSYESFEGVSRCLIHLGKQASPAFVPRRLLSTADDSRATDQDSKIIPVDHEGQSEGQSQKIVAEQPKQSPILEAHLASLASQADSLSKSRARTDRQDAEKATVLDDSPSAASGEAPAATMQQAAAVPQAAPSSRILMFDESTVARVPGEEAAAARPWDAAREAMLNEAAAALKGQRPQRGLQPQSSTPEGTPQAAATPVFREPMRYDDMPAELQPRFREIVRRRPSPVRVADVWQAVREADHNGARAVASGFVPSVDCSISLLIDPRRSDQLIRGVATLPHGTGRDARVAVFTSNPEDAEAAAAAGAVAIGGEDLVAKVAEDKGIAVDAVVATPDMVPRLGKIARVLGPKGLMPNPKFGTVTTQVGETVKELRVGKLQFRNDKGGTVSVPIGRRSFSDSELTANFYSFLQAVMGLRPKGLSGTDISGYIERVTISTTRGKGFPVSVEDITLSARTAFAQQ